MVGVGAWEMAALGSGWENREGILAKHSGEAAAATTISLNYKQCLFVVYLCKASL